MMDPDPDADPGLDRLLLLRLPLPVGGALLARLRTTLSDDERVRAARLRAAHKREEFEATRGWLRTVLGRVLGHDPAGLRFAYGEHGKPRLEGVASLGADGRGVPHFNVAHASGLAVCALTRVGPVGVDVESRSREVEVGPVSARFFTPRECAELAAVAPAGRRSAFLRGWTRKEAYLKALGSGITAGLGRPDVSLGDSPRLVADLDDPTAPARFTLLEIDVGDSHLAAAAVEGRPAGVDSRVWAPAR